MSDELRGTPAAFIQGTVSGKSLHYPRCSSREQLIEPHRKETEKWGHQGRNEHTPSGHASPGSGFRLPVEAGDGDFPEDVTDLASSQASKYPNG